MNKEIYISTLRKDSIEKLRTLANNSNIRKLSKSELIYQIVVNYLKEGKTVIGDGVVNFAGDNAYLRSTEFNYAICRSDIFLYSKIAEQFFLKEGDYIECQVFLPSEEGKCVTCSQILKINHKPPKQCSTFFDFDSLVPEHPFKKINLEMNGQDKHMLRVLDLVAPIGFGQRALILAPPKSGKTTLMHNIALAITKNHPEAYLILLLVDERPEEVTEAQRTIKGEIISSNFDEPAYSHTRVAEITLNRAKRLVESGKDVIILLDSITRLAGAYNDVTPSSGKVLSGGIDSNAMYKPKKFFGAARAFKSSGSLTIVATALVDTGSKMDEVIYEKFKGRGNCDISLKRSLLEQGIFPPLDILGSFTRRSELFLNDTEINRRRLLRQVLCKQKNEEAIDILLKEVQKTSNNFDLLQSLAR